MRYPVLSRTSILECPVHGFDVALGDDGRIVSRCPGCHTEAQRALWRWAKRAQRAAVHARDVSATRGTEEYSRG